MAFHLPQSSKQSGISDLVAYKGVETRKYMAVLIQTEKKPVKIPFSSVFEMLILCGFESHTNYFQCGMLKWFVPYNTVTLKISNTEETC